MESPDARGGSAHHNADAETPACQPCRNRKLRCSREQPACSRCSRLGVVCHYDYTKNKPGVKVGIVKTLTQRIESLEMQLEALTTQRCSADISGQYQPEPVPDANAIRDLVSGLMEEWREGRLADQSEPQPMGDYAEADDNSRPSGSSSVEVPDQQTSCKRKRPHHDDSEDATPSVPLPPDNLIDAVLDAYFSVVHPFVPILHEPLFRSRLRDPNERPKLVVVLHAIVVCALRYIANERLAVEWLQSYPDALQRSRDFVVLKGMENLSVENVQSLIIIVFVHICDGSADKAWPIVGALTRAVVYLGLHAELESGQQAEACVQSCRSLSSARVWTEAEERRRVFWNVFLLDRLCSFTTGWNVSLSAEDVKLRLPSDGTYWAKEEPVTTPFFNVWDTAMAKIGKPVSFLPSHFSSLADREKEADTGASTSEHACTVGQSLGTRPVDISTIGSFSYCIEATESLNRIVKFFLQQPVDFQSKEEFSAWLTRFKELDLQLIHWKMFLPRRWKDSNISKEPAFVHMDPNLTLAHITHNTSMILLHQCIAYPRRDLMDKLRLASIASAETCQLAASETANIVQKYLQYTPFVGVVNAQFSFCAFISARVMLVHAHLHRTDTPEGYNVLSSSLQEMSARWISTNPSLKLNSETKNFAEGLLSQLETLRERCKGSPSYGTDALHYATEVNQALGMQVPPPSLGHSQWLEERRAQQRHSIIAVNGKGSHYTNSSPSTTEADRGAFVDPTVQTPPSTHIERRWSERGASVQIETSSSHTVPASRPPVTPAPELNASFFAPTTTTAHLPPPLGDDGSDGFASLSNFLLDQQYMGTDRIISFQDSFIY